MSVLDQYQLMRCTRILIGINGAGLEWTLFMNHGSGLMELNFAIPNFGLAYSWMNQYKNLMYNAYTASRVVPDWPLITSFFGKIFTKGQKQDIIKYRRATISWKYADGEFEVHGFKTKLQNMAQKVFK